MSIKDVKKIPIADISVWECIKILALFSVAMALWAWIIFEFMDSGCGYYY